MSQSAPISPEQSGSKTILVANHAGFCHGVKKAVNKTVDTGINNTKPVYVLGQLIHNQQEVSRIESFGVTTVQDLEQVPDGSVAVIRTHGAPPELVEQAEARGIAISDATCPDVRLVQNKAVELAEEGYTVVLVGKDSHPEIIGIRAYAQRIPNAHVVCINDPAEIPEKLEGIPTRRIGVVSQTTQIEETFFDMVKALSKVAKELKVHNTICPATFFRQNAAAELASQVDLMVVVGGKNSSNTTHLADISREQGTPAVHIETWKELEGNEDLKNAQTVGVTAGASTPDWLVNEVLDYLKGL